MKYQPDTVNNIPTKGKSISDISRADIFKTGIARELSLGNNM